MELLTREKTLDFEMVFDVARKEISLVDTFNGQSGEKIGLASFQTGRTELQITRRSGSPSVIPFQASEAIHLGAASKISEALAIQKTRPPVRKPVSAASTNVKRWVI